MTALSTAALIESNVSKEFLRSSLSAGLRINDQRRFMETRSWTAIFSTFQTGQVELALNDTRVTTLIECHAVRPTVERPLDGIVSFRLHYPTTAFERDASQQEHPIHLQRTLEAIYKDGRVVDTESLCILAAKQVWSLVISVIIVNDGGNLLDAASLAVLLSLLHFRRPDVTISGEDVTIHSTMEKNPVPLTIHYWPIAVSFAIFEEGEILLVDPSFMEEMLCDGRLTVVLDAGSKEICHFHKKGRACDMVLFKEATEVALRKAIECTKRIKDIISIK